jgi:hypothetical protein
MQHSTENMQAARAQTASRIKSSNRRWEGKRQVIAMAVQLTGYGYDASSSSREAGGSVFDSSKASQPPEPSFSG